MKFEEYLEQWKNETRSRSGDGWKANQDQLIGQHILPHLVGKHMAVITSGMISKILDASKKKGHSPKTRLHLYSFLYKFFYDAVNFFDMDIKNPVKAKYHRPKVPKIKAKFMTPEQSFVLLEYVFGSRYSHGIWIQLLCGLRVSEMLPLTWGDIDFQNEQITVSRIWNKGTKTIQKYTKNGNQVYVPLPAKLKAYLKKYKGKDDDLVMPNQNKEMMCYYVYRRHLRKLAKTLKLPIRSTHGLRHSCTEIWVDVGASAEDLRRLLNHLSLSSTENYIHRTDNRLNSLAKKIA
jgi:integrase